MSELEVISGSDSGHCCFEASVRIIETEEHFCECFYPKDAEKIVNAVNYHDRLREALRLCAEVMCDGSRIVSYSQQAAAADDARALLAELDNLEKQQ